MVEIENETGFLKISFFDVFKLFLKTLLEMAAIVCLQDSKILVAISVVYITCYVVTCIVCLRHNIPEET